MSQGRCHGGRGPWKRHFNLHLLAAFGFGMGPDGGSAGNDTTVSQTEGRVPAVSWRRNRKTERERIRKTKERESTPNAVQNNCSIGGGMCTKHQQNRKRKHCTVEGCKNQALGKDDEGAGDGTDGGAGGDAGEAGIDPRRVKARCMPIIEEENEIEVDGEEGSA